MLVMFGMYIELPKLQQNFKIFSECLYVHTVTSKVTSTHRQFLLHESNFRHL